MTYLIVDAEEPAFATARTPPLRAWYVSDSLPFWFTSCCACCDAWED